MFKVRLLAFIKIKGNNLFAYSNIIYNSICIYIYIKIFSFNIHINNTLISIVQVARIESTVVISTCEKLQLQVDNLVSQIYIFYYSKRFSFYYIYIHFISFLMYVVFILLISTVNKPIDVIAASKIIT